MSHKRILAVRRAMPLMTANARAEATALLSELEGTESLAAFTRRAQAAFESDMQPVCTAIVGALQTGDMAAMKDLRALLPHLLVDVNADPTLGDLLALQLGSAFLSGLRETPSLSTGNAKWNVHKPKGVTGAGQFAAGDAMSLGATVSRARTMLDADLQACGIDTDPDPGAVVAKLCAKLKVKAPVHVLSKLNIITGGTPQEAAAVLKHAQEIFDMLPPRVVNGHGKYAGLPQFEIKIVDLPGSSEHGHIEHATATRPMTIVLNRAMGGVSKGTIFHEMAHYIHFGGPPSFRAAVQTHFRRRTAGEPMLNNGSFQFKRDHWFDDYAGRIYPTESYSGRGLELPSVHLEHLASDQACISARPNIANADHYKETMSVALSIFYYGRRK